MDNMLVVLLFVFVWLIGTIVCIILLICCIRFGRKFERELQQKCPEAVKIRKKLTLWKITFPIWYTPLMKDMLD